MSKSSSPGAKGWVSDVLCAELAQLHTGSQKTPAVLESIAETHAVLWCEEPVRRGRIVDIQAACWSFRARVAGCRKDKALQAYLILVRFFDPFRWTIDAFCPEHMLELGQPAAEGSASDLTMSAGHSL